MTGLRIRGAILAAFVMAWLIPVAGAADQPPECKPPSFAVKGVVIAPPNSKVLIEAVKQGDRSAKSSQEQWFREGDTVQGYRIEKIQRDRATLACQGKSALFVVGYGSYSPQAETRMLTPEEAKKLRGKFIPPGVSVPIDLPAKKDKIVKGSFSPAPEKRTDEMRKEAQAFFNKLQEGQFQETIDAHRQELRERMEKEQKASAVDSASETKPKDLSSRAAPR